MTDRMICWQSTTTDDFGKITTSDSTTPSLPAGTVEITDAEYELLLADFLAGVAP
jgi:hypothetical protein